MTRIILGMDINAGGSDVRVPQVVTHCFEIHVVALVRSRRMAHPVGGGLLHMRSGCLVVRA